MSSHENASFNVGAALLRGDLLVQAGRRLEIGSHTPPQTAIFIDWIDLINVTGRSLLKISNS